MHQTPFLDDGSHLAWQLTLTDFTRGNDHQGFKPLVLHMNVWRWMIVVPHPNDDAEKNSDGGHGAGRL